VGYFKHCNEPPGFMKLRNSNWVTLSFSRRTVLYGVGWLFYPIGYITDASCSNLLFDVNAEIHHGSGRYH